MEKTAIQALGRLNPVLPLSPGRAERHGFEYYGHGTLSREIHIVCDNLSAHKTQTVKDFLAANPRVRFTSLPRIPRGSIRSKLVYPHPARRHLTRRFHIRRRSLQNADEIHPNLRQTGEAFSLDLF